MYSLLTSLMLLVSLTCLPIKIVDVNVPLWPIREMSRFPPEGPIFSMSSSSSSAGEAGGRMDLRDVVGLHIPGGGAVGDRVPPWGFCQGDWPCWGPAPRLAAWALALALGEALAFAFALPAAFVGTALPSKESNNGTMRAEKRTSSHLRNDNCNAMRNDSVIKMTIRASGRQNDALNLRENLG